jgi:transcriptional antiterminator NusG
MEHRFYAIQTTAGHENKVRSLIQRKIDADSRSPEERSLRQALVPTQEVVEIKNGKKVTVERKIFPGYVLVEMVMTQETLHTINGIQGVIKFVGHERLPQPLRPEEVNRLLGIVILPEDTKDKWLKKANAEDFSEMGSDQIEACISFLKKRLTSEA